MKILIADDDRSSSALLARILARDPEHQITVVEDGAATWRMLDDPARSFDVLFLDLSMPKIDGYTLLQRIQQSLLLKSLEVVVCTSANERASVVRAIQLGARHYLVKPCSETLVLEKLRQLQPDPDPTPERRFAGA